MNLFMRNYKLTISQGGQVSEIKPELNISFNVQKSVSGGLNQAEITVFNLSKARRDNLVKTMLDNKKKIAVVLEIGYGDKLELLFKGSVYTGSTLRDGNNIATRLVCYDGGFEAFNSSISGAFDSMGEMAKASVDSLALDAGEIITDTLSRPLAVFGNAFSELAQNKSKDSDVFIDNERLNVIPKSSTIKHISTLNASTGLINVERDAEMMIADCKINPSIKIGAAVNLESSLDASMNGLYKVIEANYNGTFDGGSWDQSIKMIKL